jgi:hypothetical protein
VKVDTSGEVWRIRTSHAKIFHVIAATCEVLGHERYPIVRNADGYDLPELRPDWALFLEKVSSDSATLLQRLQWENREEYDLGISHLWKKRILNDSVLGSELLTLAERYVTAHVLDKG